MMATLLIGLPLTVFSQRTTSLDVNFGFYVNDSPFATGYIQVTHTWWLNRYIGISAGGGMAKSKIDTYWKANQGEYFLDKNIIPLNALGAVEFTMPVISKFGVFAEGRFIFEPIPFDNISLEVHRNNKVTHKSKYAFTGFNPSGVLNGGFYYDFNSGDSKVRFALGYGMGIYDIYNGYRRITIDGQNISAHIPPKSLPVQNIFISISVFM